MPPEPAPPVPEPPVAASVIASLDRAVAVVRGRLDTLRDGRRHDTALTDGWQGGHRARFEDALAETERLARRLEDTLARLALASRRVRDEADR